jgi:hypothetical protein
MLAENLTLQSPSMTTVFIRMMVSSTNTELASGTGFFYELNDKIYLITNGHNVTGVNPETKKRLSDSHCGFPDTIEARIKAFADEEKETIVPGRKLIGLHPIPSTTPLYKDQDFLKPEWLIHPKFGYDVDVIALYICDKNDLPKHLAVTAINSLNFENEVPVSVSDDVFVLGYPYKLNGAMELPIWKRGSIATEPSIDIDKLPKILIDTATRPGMSGSPVIFQRSGIMNRGDSTTLQPDSIIGTIQGFVGVYSGRIGATDKFDAQLGIVWKGHVIDEIINGGINGTCEFQNFL